ncbi:MAG: dienelactone hydrolase family protein [Candidatus Acidiferrales bacterium]
MKLSRLAGIGAAMFCLIAQATRAPGYVEREVMIPWVAAAPNGLDVLEVYFDTPGKHPLVVMTHGTSRKPEERANVTPWAQLPQALWFARRGWYVLMVVRRGYGHSSGEIDGKHSGHCPNPDYQSAAEYSAADLREAVEYARTLPQVDTTKVMAVGVSTGGLATVALTADPPQGLVAGINFAGGRGSKADHDVCDPADLIHAYKNFGKHSRLPMLWLYAENDKYFWPELAQKFDAAFKSSGGQDQFVLAPAIGDDGHSLFRHPEAWGDTVSTFLIAHNLAPLAEPYPELRAPDVDPPAGLSENGLEAFHSYLLLGPHKAFAKSTHGYGYAMAKIRVDDARTTALENCNRASAAGDTCAVVNVDNAVVSK